MFLLSTSIGTAVFIMSAGWYCGIIVCEHFADYEVQVPLSLTSSILLLYNAYYLLCRFHIQHLRLIFAILNCVLRSQPSLLVVTVMSALTCLWVGTD